MRPASWRERRWAQCALFASCANALQQLLYISSLHSTRPGCHEAAAGGFYITCRRGSCVQMMDALTDVNKDLGSRRRTLQRQLVKCAPVQQLGGFAAHASGQSMPFRELHHTIYSTGGQAGVHKHLKSQSPRQLHASRELEALVYALPEAAALEQTRRQVPAAQAAAVGTGKPRPRVPRLSYIACSMPSAAGLPHKQHVHLFMLSRYTATVMHTLSGGSPAESPGLICRGNRQP